MNSKEIVVCLPNYNVVNCQVCFQNVTSARIEAKPDIKADTMKRIKYVVAFGLLINLILLAFFGWVVYRSLNATYVYNWHIEYATMPVTDDALADCLKSQPGITHATISREKSSIVVNYE